MTLLYMPNYNEDFSRTSSDLELCTQGQIQAHQILAYIQLYTTKVNSNYNYIHMLHGFEDKTKKCSNCICILNFDEMYASVH